MTGEGLRSVLQPTTPSRYRWSEDVAKAQENLLWHYHREVSKTEFIKKVDDAVKAKQDEIMTI